tara:strand:+ start:237 stop:662 length:426 start_codon:yes stop_codon:yes gene_type:complete
MALGKIKADTLEHSTAGSLDTQFVVNGSAKAWVNMNGSGTPAARDSLNLSSITDHASGEYSINMSSAFANINYSNTASQSSNTNASNRAYTFIGMHQSGGSGTAIVAPTTTVYRFLVSGGSTIGTNYDAVHIDVHTMGDLA